MVPSIRALRERSDLPRSNAAKKIHEAATFRFATLNDSKDIPAASKRRNEKVNFDAFEKLVEDQVREKDEDFVDRLEWATKPRPKYVPAIEVAHESSHKHLQSVPAKEEKDDVRLKSSSSSRSCAFS